MTQVADHEGININDFGGLYGRDSFGDSCPPDHFVDSLNTIIYGAELRTRDGFGAPSITMANTLRARIYKRQGEASRLLILNNAGNLYDTSVSLSVPILSIATMTDFALINYYDRAYISPCTGIAGLAGEKLYVYNGTGTARAAAGSAPVGGFNVALSATTGNVEVGLHIFAVAYITDSGFITAPGPVIFPTLDVSGDGDKSLDLSNIPTGPTGTAQRCIIASRAIQDYNGNQDGYEMFFVPSGVIANNTGTTITINFFDADLQLSADYLFDQLSIIPAGLFLSSYRDRLCVGGEDENQSMVRMSKLTEPESFNELSGFILCDPLETEGVKAGVEFQDNFYVTKGLPGKTYFTRDNTYEPSTWVVPSLDKAVGADNNGLSVMLDQTGSVSRYFLAADRSGLYLFDGAYQDIPLSYKIQNIWDRINKAVFYKCQLVIDTKNFVIYISVPLDSATTPSHILVASYADGLNATDIDWHLWSSAAFTPNSIVVGINNTTKQTYLRVLGTSNVFDQEDSRRNDNSLGIDSYVQFAYLFLEQGFVHTFAGIRYRVKGSGTLASSFRGEDASSITNLPNITLSTAPGKEYFIQSIFFNEKCSAKLRTSTAGDYWILRSASLFARPLYATRPA